MIVCLPLLAMIWLFIDHCRHDFQVQSTEGLAIITGIFIFWCGLIAVKSNSAQWSNRYLLFLVGLAFLEAVLGIIEFFSEPFFSYLAPAFTNTSAHTVYWRIAGTASHPNQYAGFLLMGVTLSFFLASRTKGKIGWRLFFNFTVLTVILLSLVLSISRGALLGLLGGGHWCFVVMVNWKTSMEMDSRCIHCYSDHPRSWHLAFNQFL